MQRLARLIARVPYPTARQQWAVGIAVVVTQAIIGVTGSVVRVTGSGLGCSTWPGCHAGTMFPTTHPEYETLTQWIEFGNRLLTAVVGLAAIAGVVVAWRIRQEVGRKRPLALALTVLGGTGLQGVLGGITVLAGLLWWTVALHFLVSAALVWTAVLLARSLREGDDEPRLLVSPVTQRLLQVLAVGLAAVLAAGTMVTGAGPHGGDPDTPRLGIPVETMAHVHAAFLYAFLGSLVLLGFWLRGQHAFPPPWRRYRTLVAVVLAQGTIGFVQFWTGVPELLVCLHVLGAMCVIIATGSLWCGVRGRAAAKNIVGNTTVA